MCVPGDVIFARARALVRGVYHVENFESDVVDTKWLGSAEVYSCTRAVDVDMISTIVIARSEFKDRSLNYLHVVSFDGETMRIFDDYEHGFWLPFSELGHRVFRQEPRESIGQFVRGQFVNDNGESYMKWVTRPGRFNDHLFRRRRRT